MGCESGQEGERPWQIEFHRTASPGFSRVGHGRGQRAGSDFTDQRDPQRTLGPARGLLPAPSLPPGLPPLSPPGGTSRALLALIPATWNLSFVFFQAPRSFLREGALPHEQVSHSRSQTRGPDLHGGDDLHPAHFIPRSQPEPSGFENK